LLLGQFKKKRGKTNTINSGEKNKRRGGKSSLFVEEKRAQKVLAVFVGGGRGEGGVFRRPREEKKKREKGGKISANALRRKWGKRSINTKRENCLLLIRMKKGETTLALSEERLEEKGKNSCLKPPTNKGEKDKNGKQGALAAEDEGPEEKRSSICCKSRKEGGKKKKGRGPNKYLRESDRGCCSHNLPREKNKKRENS